MQSFVMSKQAVLMEPLGFKGLNFRNNSLIISFYIHIQKC
jgi:hypothetical protein